MLWLGARRGYATIIYGGSAGARREIHSSGSLTIRPSSLSNSATPDLKLDIARFY
jgi:hypothetical protein